MVIVMAIALLTYAVINTVPTSMQFQSSAIDLRLYPPHQYQVTKCSLQPLNEALKSSVYTSIYKKNTTANTNSYLMCPFKYP